MNGRIIITKLYSDGNKEVVLDDNNILTVGFGKTITDILTTSSSEHVDNYRIGYFQAGKGGKSSQPTTQFGNKFLTLASPLTKEDYGKHSNLDIEKLRAVVAVDEYVSSLELSNRFDALATLPTSQITKREQDSVYHRIVIDRKTANGQDLQEFGMFIKNPDGASSVDNIANFDKPILAAYKELVSPIKKESNFEIIIEWIFSFRSLEDTPNFVFVLLDDAGPELFSFCHHMNGMAADWRYPQDPDNSTGPLSGDGYSAIDVTSTEIDNPYNEAIDAAGKNIYAHLPVLTDMVNQGVLFDNSYACPQCSPARASFLTGKKQINHGIGKALPKNPGRYSGGAIKEFNDPDLLDSSKFKSITVAEVLQNVGYYTGAFGKWHLNMWQGLMAPAPAHDHWANDVEGYACGMKKTGAHGNTWPALAHLSCTWPVGEAIAGKTYTFSVYGQFVSGSELVTQTNENTNQKLAVAIMEPGDYNLVTKMQKSNLDFDYTMELCPRDYLSNNKGGRVYCKRASVTFTFAPSAVGQDVQLALFLVGINDNVGDTHYISHAQLEKGSIGPWTDNYYLSGYGVGNLLASGENTYNVGVPAIGLCSAGGVWDTASDKFDSSSFEDINANGDGFFAGLQWGQGMNGPTTMGFDDFRLWPAGYSSWPGIRWDQDNFTAPFTADLGVSSESQDQAENPYNMIINDNLNGYQWGWGSLNENWAANDVSTYDFSPDEYGYYYTGRKTFLDARDFVANAPEPFFAYINPNDIHTPNILPPSDLVYTDEFNKGSPIVDGGGQAFIPQSSYTSEQNEQSPGKNFRAKLESVDVLLGQLKNSMGRERYNNTIFIIMGDNGTQTGSNQSLFYNASASPQTPGGGDQLRPGPTLMTSAEWSYTYGGPGGDSPPGLINRYINGEGVFKQSVMELGSRSPLIICGPAVEGDARTVSALVHIADIMPTILDILNIEIPESVDGISFKDILEDDTKTARSDHSRDNILLEIFAPNGDFTHENLIESDNDRRFGFSYVVSGASEASDCGRFKLNLSGNSWIEDEDPSACVFGFYKLEASDGTKVDPFEFSSITPTGVGEPYWEAFTRTFNKLGSELEFSNGWPGGDLPES